MQDVYDHELIEKKQQQKWLDNKTFESDEDDSKPKYYCLSMLPYPSGKLHMGHVRNYTIGDVLARFHLLKGYNVLQPYGFDAFGLPAENAALQNKLPPAKWTYQNIEYMKWQLKSLGLAVDWRREFATCSPQYYKHQQWLFLKLYEKGLVYRKNGIVNWDPVDQTVLANEQVIDGRGWRSGAIVEKKEVPMYYLKITAYAEQLLQDLEELPLWPEQVKTMQKNWIGKSKGLEIKFTINWEMSNLKPQNLDLEQITIFTTRSDTLMGVTYLAIGIDHELIKLINLNNNTEINNFIQEARLGGVSEAELALTEKKGIFSGVYVSHPITQELIPVWITNYVISEYGTGAVMGVPAHDERDFSFAKNYNLPIKQVITSNEKVDSTQESVTLPYLESGILINSGVFTGLDSVEAYSRIKEYIEAHNLGNEKITYRLRDWGISRQRYWGCPIPIIHCAKCGEVAVPEEDLPVALPDNLIPDASGSILTKTPEFYEVNCPKCGEKAKRETDTMDTFVDSSWYFLRYPSFDAHNQIVDERVNYWAPIDQYIGGIEHAILHLLYARFLHKCFYDLGLVSSKEPFNSLITQGMVLAPTFYKEDSNGHKQWLNLNEVDVKKDEKGNITLAVSKLDNQKVHVGHLEKMSKSKNNGVDPQAIIERYGADTARLFMMFAAPVDQALEWSDNGLEGASRFIKRLWRIIHEHLSKKPLQSTIEPLTSSELKLQAQLHQVIAKVTNDIEKRKQFNTAIASIMELLNSYSKFAFATLASYNLAKEILESVVIMLYPIIPHVCEEIWEHLNPNTSLVDHGWVEFNERLLELNEVEVIIQVNGKLRAKINVPLNESREEIEKLALTNSNVQKFIEGYEIKKVIVVPNKIINIVI